VKTAKTIALIAFLVGLVMAPLWLGVFFGTGSYSPKSEILIMETVYVIWHVLLYGGLVAFLALVVVDRFRRRPVPPPKTDGSQ